MSALDFNVMAAIHGLQDRGFVIVSPAEQRAGSRLLAPGELDDETLERAAEAVEAMGWYRHTSPDHVEANRPKDYASAIRSLTPGSMEGQRE